MGTEESSDFPRRLVCAARAEGRTEWLTTVPDTVAKLADRWSLTLGAPFQPGGHTAWVAPARNRDGTMLVLKVAWRHPEAYHEADGLRAWNGEGAVRLFRRRRNPRHDRAAARTLRPGQPVIR